MVNFSKEIAAQISATLEMPMLMQRFRSSLKP